MRCTPAGLSSLFCIGLVSGGIRIGKDTYFDTVRGTSCVVPRRVKKSVFGDCQIASAAPSSRNYTSRSRARLLEKGKCRNSRSRDASLMYCACGTRREAARRPSPCALMRSSRSTSCPLFSILLTLTMCRVVAMIIRLLGNCSPYAV